MPIANGQVELRRIEFEFGDVSYRFNINPQEYKESHPQRANIQQTKSSILVSDFGRGIRQINISGTTGFRKGVEKFKEMKRFLEDYQLNNEQENAGGEPFFFHNYTNDEHYVVHIGPEGVNYSQSVNTSIMFDYQISFLVLRDASDPAPEDIVSPTIGNENSTFTNTESITTPISADLAGGPGGDAIHPDVVDITDPITDPQQRLEEMMGL